MTMSNELMAFEKSLELAGTLTKFIKERNLTSNIKGKDFVQVDGWQFAGSQLGIVPILTSLENQSNEKEYKYRAEVDLVRLTDGMKVGKGIAICSNKESTKKNFEEYAIASMAQTRAEGKAFRMFLSWLIKAAGFEATPAEEAEDFERPDMPTEDEKQTLRKLVFNSTLDNDKRSEALATIDGCYTYDLFAKIQGRLEDLQLPIDQVVNPSQKDINGHLRKTVKA
jgi:hypothetical protein